MATPKSPAKSKSAGQGATPTKSAGSTKSQMSKAGVDQELIRQLAALLKETDLSEIEIETDGLKLRVSRQMQAVNVPVSVSAPQAHAPAAAAPAASDPSVPHPGTVNSPMVGTAYLSPEPGAPAFVQVGSTVKEGQTMLIIEAMKTMNHIPAPRSGKITKILVEDGQPVEFGEPLCIIE